MLRSIERSRGTGPRATVAGTASLTVGRGPVPRHAPIAEETRSDARMETSEGLRATGPKTIAGDRPPRDGIRNGLGHRRARACPSPCTDRGGNPLGCAYGNLRGPRATRPKTIAGACPPRYGIRNGSFYRRARACPSPCCVNRKIARDRPSPYGKEEKNARGTGPRATVIERSRGTGPRATGP